MTTHTGFPGASRCLEPSPEAEDGDDDDHQHQHHTHDRSACNQGQLLPPTLILWGRKHTIRRIRPPRGPGTSLVEELWFPKTVWQVGEDKGEPGWGNTGVFKPLSTGRAPLRASEEVSQPYYCQSGFDLVLL